MASIFSIVYAGSILALNYATPGLNFLVLPSVVLSNPALSLALNVLSNLFFYYGLISFTIMFLNFDYTHRAMSESNTISL